jgi:DUF1365 family protein
MPNLKQQAEMDAFKYRNYSSAKKIDDMKFTEDGLRKIAESHAVNFINANPDEYEDVKATVKEYMDAFIEVFREQGDLLTPAQYEAHSKAIKDAEEEMERAREWKRSPKDDATTISVNAFFAAGEYILMRFVGIRGMNSSENQLTVLLEDPEVLQIHRQYIKQYTQSYKERIVQYRPPEQKWWQRLF